jgi:hypothetical protein
MSKRREKVAKKTKGLQALKMIVDAEVSPERRKKKRVSPWPMNFIPFMV